MPQVPEKIEIWDCRHKNLAVIRRLSGDLVVEFFENGKLVFSNWYKLKGASKHDFKTIQKSFAEIMTHLSRIKELLERQDK